MRALRASSMATRVSTFARASRRLSTGAKIACPPITYIKGEEMTAYCMELIMAKWVEPHIDTSQWEFYDLSCKSRDDTEDKCLHDAVASGARLKAIFKEPTVTPTEIQKKALGLKKAWGSPNGAMRRGWNGITISRDTIHIEGMELGYKRPVLFERHAVGGEYGAGFKEVGAGKVLTTYHPADGSSTIIVDERTMPDTSNAVVTYHNPLDNVPDLAHHFFTRCLEAEVRPVPATAMAAPRPPGAAWPRRGLRASCPDGFSWLAAGDAVRRDQEDRLQMARGPRLDWQIASRPVPCTPTCTCRGHAHAVDMHMPWTCTCRGHAPAWCTRTSARRHLPRAGLLEGNEGRLRRPLPRQIQVGWPTRQASQIWHAACA